MGALSERARAAAAAVRRGVSLTDGWLHRLRESLTPGQRWTAGLALALAVVVLRFGAPVQTTFVSPLTRAAPPSEVAGAPDAGTTTADEVEGRAGFAGPPPPPPSGVAAQVSARDDSSTGADRAGSNGEQAVVGIPKVVALVRTGEDAPPGRDDRSMAEAFLAHSTFAATVVEYDPEEVDGSAVCAEQAGADVVLASLGLPVGLRDCLLDQGARVVSYDERSSGVEGGVSTRRAVSDVLVDLARWGAAKGVLRGTVGLAASEDLRGQVALALPDMRRAGVDPVVHYLGDAGGVADGVQAFAGEGVETTVFALPAARQREWVTLDRLLNRDVDYVVADAAAAVVEGGYPPLFDGALAYTSLVYPWHEETPEQEECRERWEGAGGRVPGTMELFRAFTWCQHVSLVGEVVGQVRDDQVSLAEAFSAVELTSPLTTALGPLADGGFGPRIDHVLTWDASCACWADPVPAADRSPSPPRS